MLLCNKLGVFPTPPIFFGKFLWFSEWICHPVCRGCLGPCTLTAALATSGPCASSSMCPTHPNVQLVPTSPQHSSPIPQGREPQWLPWYPTSPHGPFSSIPVAPSAASVSPPPSLSISTLGLFIIHSLKGVQLPFPQ